MVKAPAAASPSFAAGVLPQALDDLVQRGLRVFHLVQRVQDLLQRPPGLVPVRFRVLQSAAGVGVVLNGDSNRPGRGTLVGKGLERLQVGPVRRGESQRDAGSVCHNGISWLVRRGQNDSISLARYRRLGPRSGNICYHLRAATWPGLDNNAIILQ